MMQRWFFTVVLMLTGAVSTVSAQNLERGAWVQIEAHPSFEFAAERAVKYAADLTDVTGFTFGNGWFGIALGPYSREDAGTVLRAYRSEGAIPQDSFIAFGAGYQRQFFPAGQDLLGIGMAAAPEAPETQAAQVIAEAPVQTAPPTPVANAPKVAQFAPETPAQARASEAALSSSERRDIQTALRWAGVYDAAIDGAFGRGTRTAMANWQANNGLAPTGVLTTSERAELARQYNAVLADLGLETVRDEPAGISVLMPKNTVAFDRYDPPFAHYRASGNDDIGVYLISQSGDAGTLASLYETLQTLRIVPKNGARQLGSNGFTITGQDAQIISETRVTLAGGTLKGMMLVWPSGDEERRARLLDRMWSSFEPFGNTLDPALGDREAQDVSLVSGLQIRAPKSEHSGIFVDAKGTALTLATAVTGCTEITLDGDTLARVLWSDPQNNVAVLGAQTPMAPLGFAQFGSNTPRINAPVMVAGYSFGGVLDAPSMSFGALKDIKNLEGDAQNYRLSITTTSQDAGGPVLNSDGHVIGMLTPPQSAQILPEGVSFAQGKRPLSEALALAGIAAQTAQNGVPLAPQDLAQRASDMTALIGCW